MKIRVSFVVALLFVFVLLFAIATASANDEGGGGDVGGAGGGARSWVDDRIHEYRRAVRATYYPWGHIISVADTKPDPGLGEKRQWPKKKKPAPKPAEKKK